MSKDIQKTNYVQTAEPDYIITIGVAVNDPDGGAGTDKIVSIDWSDMLRHRKFDDVKGMKKAVYDLLYEATRQVG